MVERNPRPTAIGWLIAIGSAVLLAGLLAGPTPGEEPAVALRNIDGFRVRWVATNAIDLIGVTLLVVGLSALSRLRATGQEGSLLSTAAQLGSALGGVLMAVVLIIQATVDVGVAARYVAADGAEQSTQLAIGRALLDLEAALFGLGLLIFMAAVACIAIALLRAEAPHLVNRGFLIVGTALTLFASTTGVAFLIGPLKPFGRLEPFFALTALLWILVLGALLARPKPAARLTP